MLRKPNNVFSVILENQVTAGFPTAGTKVTDANLPIGAAVMTDLGLVVTDLASLSDGDQFLIVQGKGVGNPLMKSPVLTKGKISITSKKFIAAEQQITTVGYDGSTVGTALPTANDTDFFIKIRKNDNDAANRSQPMSLFAGPVKTDDVGTQLELAEALIANGIVNFSKEPANGYLTFDLLCDEAGAANTGAGTVTATQGSKLVTFGTDVDAVAVVGDYIRFDESAGGAPATTDAVYRVVAMDTTNEIMTLDRPFSSASQAATAQGNAVIIDAATAAGAECGVRLTGVAADFDVNAFRDYYANRFTVTFSDPTTAVTHIQGAFNGNGMFQQVAMDEYMSYGYEGQNDMLATPPRLRDQEVKIPGVGGVTAVDAKYSAVNIAWEEGIDGLVSLAKGKGNVVIYLNLEDNGSGSGILATTGSSGEVLAGALGLTASNLDE